MQTETGNLKETLQPLLRVLRDLGGKFSFSDDQGNQFVLASKEVLEGEHEQATEQQLMLPEAETVSRAIRKHIDAALEDEVLDRINRDIALAYAVTQELEEQEVAEDLSALTEDTLSEDMESFDSNKNIPVPPRIRFEPLKGDLPPELQE